MDSRTFKCEGKRNDHLLHYEQVFGNVFERREIKCRGVLTKHCRKVKGGQVITLQIAQQLKTKNINVIPGQLFCRQCKAKFLLETETDYIDDEDKGQHFAVIDDEFTEWQTPREKLQTIAISPVSLHAEPQYSRITNGKMKLDKGMHTMKSNISEANNVQADCWEDS